MSLEIKCYHFEKLIFWDIFSGSSLILYKNVPGNRNQSFFIVENSWEQRKRALLLKTLLATFSMQMHRKTVFLWKRLRRDLIFRGMRIFLLIFFSSDIFL